MKNMYIFIEESIDKACIFILYWDKTNKRNKSTQYLYYKVQEEREVTDCEKEKFSESTIGSIACGRRIIRLRSGRK